MKTLKHIYKYLTSPSYRYWVDFCTRKENLDRQMDLIKRELKLQNHPIYIYQDTKPIKFL